MRERVVGGGDRESWEGERESGKGVFLRERQSR